MFLASGCSSVASYGVGGGGGGHRGLLMGVATVRWGDGGNSRGGPSVSIDVSSVSTVRVGVHLGADGGGGGSRGVGGNSALGGWGQKWGVSTVGVSSTSKNRLSHHKSPRQFELKQLKGSKST